MKALNNHVIRQFFIWVWYALSVILNRFAKITFDRGLMGENLLRGRDSRLMRIWAKDVESKIYRAGEFYRAGGFYKAGEFYRAGGFYRAGKFYRAGGFYRVGEFYRAREWFNNADWKRP